MIKLRHRIIEKYGFAYEIFEIVSFAVIIAFFIKTYVIASYFIPSSSMESTFNINDRLFAVKRSFLEKRPRYGQVIIFRHPEKNNTNYIKRIVGVAYDKIQIYDGILYRNGIACKESYLKEPYIHGNFGPIIVEPGKVFVLGDNRNNSSDSRSFGAVDINKIEAYPLFRYWPLQRMSKMNNSLTSFISF